jgi:hypothetical protein
MLQPFKVLKIDAKLIFFSTSDSLYHRYAESSTPRLNDTWSRRLSVSTIRGVDDSRRLPVSLSLGVVFRIRISPRIRSQNRNGSKCSVRDLCRTDYNAKTSENPVRFHVPLSCTRHVLYVFTIAEVAQV